MRPISIPTGRAARTANGVRLAQGSLKQQHLDMNTEGWCLWCSSQDTSDICSPWFSKAAMVWFYWGSCRKAVHKGIVSPLCRETGSWRINDGRRGMAHTAQDPASGRLTASSTTAQMQTPEMMDESRKGTGSTAISMQAKAQSWEGTCSNDSVGLIRKESLPTLKQSKQKTSILHWLQLQLKLWK